MQKVLCVCQGGNSRSVACSFLLKYRYGCDALAASWETNSVETLTMLYEWADIIIVMQAEFEERVYLAYRDKVVVIDVGPDIWFNGLHPDLLKKCDDLLLQYVVAPETTVDDTVELYRRDDTVELYRRTVDDTVELYRRTVDDTVELYRRTM